MQFSNKKISLTSDYEFRDKSWLLKQHVYDSLYKPACVNTPVITSNKQVQYPELTGNSTYRLVTSFGEITYLT